MKTLIIRYHDNREIINELFAREKASLTIFAFWYNFLMHDWEDGVFELDISNESVRDTEHIINHFLCHGIGFTIKTVSCQKFNKTEEK